MAGRGDYLIAIGYLAVLALFGGGPVTWGDAYMVMSVATLVVTTAWAWREGPAFLQTLSVPARVGLVGIAIIPLLQLVPLPPALWHQLPGQDLRRDTLALAGLEGSWQPLTLEPASTALIAVLAIGFVALVGSMLRVTDAQFRRLLVGAVVLVALGVAVGLVQVLSNGWPFLQVRNMGGTLIGFMANKNHMALLIACAIVLIGLPVGHGMIPRERRSAVTGGFILFALVCIVTTNSRAGLILASIAAAIVLADMASGRGMRWRIAALALLAVLVLAIVGSDAFEVIRARANDVDDDLRWSFLQWSRPLVESYWLLGSGLGSFATLFAAQEQLAWVKPTYVNAVHNDYFQLVLEAGVPGVIVLIALVGVILGRVSVWRTLSRRDPRRREMAAGFVILLLFALHSVVDYPLRRPAAWAFAALALASILRPPSIQSRKLADPT